MEGTIYIAGQWTIRDKRIWGKEQVVCFVLPCHQITPCQSWWKSEWLVNVCRLLHSPWWRHLITGEGKTFRMERVRPEREDNQISVEHSVQMIPKLPLRPGFRKTKSLKCLALVLHWKSFIWCSLSKMIDLLKKIAYIFHIMLYYRHILDSIF